jgi:hypothetical protein
MPDIKTRMAGKSQGGYFGGATKFGGVGWCGYMIGNLFDHWGGIEGVQ